ncbi:hypothetical protein [Microbulbifer sp. GL-2]|uniref:hypothetical protein n=1 Tax=Microbulbifer sp. GL-2 TaxID=2591606 RepID=UPI001163A1B2|nr:hypothetical protein [Microbulbifer sp. GL-2]BBM01302.1 hypothetical protein GL2_13760 [Microbulbifer sp. GL-2]
MDMYKIHGIKLDETGIEPNRICCKWGKTSGKLGMEVELSNRYELFLCTGGVKLVLNYGGGVNQWKSGGAFKNLPILNNLPIS